jgi:hypothetical protein
MKRLDHGETHFVPQLAGGWELTQAALLHNTIFCLNLVELKDVPVKEFSLRNLLRFQRVANEVVLAGWVE